jgi:hypothetical protein
MTQFVHNAINSTISRDGMTDLSEQIAVVQQPSQEAKKVLEGMSANAVEWNVTFNCAKSGNEGGSRRHHANLRGSLERCNVDSRASLLREMSFPWKPHLRRKEGRVSYVPLLPRLL